MDKNPKTPILLHTILKYTLLISLLISFYIFVNTLFLQDIKENKTFSTWQFPMLLAIYIDNIYYC
jgi:hypothetical protein